MKSKKNKKKKNNNNLKDIRINKFVLKHNVKNTPSHFYILNRYFCLKIINKYVKDKQIDIGFNEFYKQDLIFFKKNKNEDLKFILEAINGLKKEEEEKDKNIFVQNNILNYEQILKKISNEVIKSQNDIKNNQIKKLKTISYNSFDSKNFSKILNLFNHTKKKVSLYKLGFQILNTSLYEFLFKKNVNFDDILSKNKINKASNLNFLSNEKGVKRFFLNKINSNYLSKINKKFYEKYLITNDNKELFLENCEFKNFTLIKDKYEIEKISKLFQNKIKKNLKNTKFKFRKINLFNNIFSKIENKNNIYDLQDVSFDLFEYNKFLSKYKNKLLNNYKIIKLNRYKTSFMSFKKSNMNLIFENFNLQEDTNVLDSYKKLNFKNNYNTKNKKHTIDNLNIEIKNFIDRNINSFKNQKRKFLNLNKISLIEDFISEKLISNKKINVLNIKNKRKLYEFENLFFEKNYNEKNRFLENKSFNITDNIYKLIEKNIQKYKNINKNHIKKILKNDILIKKINYCYYENEKNNILTSKIDKNKFINYKNIIHNPFKNLNIYETYTEEKKFRKPEDIKMIYNKSNVKEIFEDLFQEKEQKLSKKNMLENKRSTRFINNNIKDNLSYNSSKNKHQEYISKEEIQDMILSHIGNLDLNSMLNIKMEKFEHNLSIEKYRNGII